MTHVIERIAIKQIKILVGIASPDRKCCQSIVAHRHARQVLQGTHHIRLTQKIRQSLYPLRLKLLHAGTGAQGLLPEGRTNYQHLIQLPQRA